MKTAIQDEQLRRFADVVTRRLGLRAREPDQADLRAALAARAASSGRAVAEYVDWLADTAGMDELGALATWLANGESYFFRDQAQFQVLAAVAIPQLIRRRGPQQPIQVLSAGCSTGEEAYSLAITLREALPDPSWARVVGVDVNPVALARAASGRYSPWSLRATPEQTRQRWFSSDGAETVIDESIRAAVRFEWRNLAEDQPGPPVPGGYDVIFCRNVLMYFDPGVARQVLARIESALAPDGFLFVGSAETLRQLSAGFEVRHAEAAFYYQRAPVGGARPPRPQPVPHTPADPAPATPLATPPAASPAADLPVHDKPVYDKPMHERYLPGPPHGAVPDLAVPLDMLRRDLYQDALTILAGLPAEAAEDPDALLLWAVLLTHTGQFAEAEEVCQRLLAVDPANPAAHFVLGTCHAGRGDDRRAAAHYGEAAARDPRFSMPHLHLGLLASRRGDRDRAQRELRRALTLLPGEDTARVLLFGGGFSRSALVELCRAELEMCGGRS